MENIYSLSRDDLIKYFENKNLKKYKAVQVYEWLYDKRVNSFEGMTNLKKDLILDLKKDFYFGKIDLEKVQTDKDANKYLFKLEDDNLIEAVLMKHDYGNSLCISSQVGCNMGCAFCASGKLKKVRNLTTGEMVEQILIVESYLKKRISSVVIMGIGEPFDNYDNVINFFKVINDAKGLAIGARHITVSTSGLVPKIKEFAAVPMQINLAVSLHFADDESRSKYMPINKAYGIKELIDSIKYYISKTNRRVTIEYILLDGINDSIEDAKKLVKLLRGLNVYVNLIPYNETGGEFKPSKEKNKDLFYKTIKDSGIVVTVRRRFGENIEGACGQLRANEVKK